jgi:hypothetical protein
VQDGVSGVLVGSSAEAVRALALLHDFAPDRVRAFAEQRFDSERMVDEYVAVYRRILSGAVPPAPRAAEISAPR